MNVAELIAILRNLDPAAEVVVAADDGRRDVHHVLELRRNDVRASAMREVSFESPFDIDHGVRLFEVDDDGPVSGVEIG